VRDSTRSDVDLVGRAAAGDVDAFTELVRVHQDLAFRVAWTVCRSTPDAEEAAQDAFVKAYRSMGRFRPGADFRPWLLAIVANEARNRRRSVARRELYELQAASRPTDEQPQPEAAAIAADRRQVLIAAVEQLPERERLIVACRFWLGLSEEETARTAGVARGTVKSRTARAMSRLQSILGEATDV
jgi:RNA polymerase sigma-70 factor (ECF subfamily)